MEYSQTSKNSSTPRLFGWTLRDLNAAAGTAIKVIALLAISYTIIIARSEKLLIVSAIIVGVFLLAALLVGRRDFKLAALYVSSVVLFAHVRAFADETGIPIHRDYAHSFDEAVGLGVLPSAYLQSHLYNAGQISALDWATYFIYASYFTVIHALTGLIWLFKRSWFSRHIVMAVSVFWAGLLLYYLVPTAPPWMAAPGDVHRVIDVVGREVNAASYDAGQDTFGTNPVAAMPSVHMAITVVVALTLWKLSKPLGILGALYALSMGFSLVYLGEHYVVDVLAGTAIAIAAYLAVTVYQRPLAAAFERLRRVFSDSFGRRRPEPPEIAEPFLPVGSTSLDVAVDD